MVFIGALEDITSYSVDDTAHVTLSNDPSRLDVQIPAAATWIRIIGKGIYEMEGEIGNEYDSFTTSWKGKKGWSKERFAFWRERFQELGETKGIRERTREVAMEAGRLMIEIEAGNRVGE